MSTAAAARRNHRIDCLKAFASVLVLFGHVLTDMGGLPAWLQITETLVYAVHVPLFFMAAGYLCHRQPLGLYYRKKARRILVPFLFFCVLKIGVFLYVPGPFTREKLAEHAVNAFLYGRYFWFCSAALLVFAAAPILWRRDGAPGVTKWGLWLAVACAAGDTACGVLGRSFPELFQIKRAIYYFPYFTLGYAVKEYREPVLKWVRSRTPLLSAAGIAGITAYAVLVRHTPIPENFFPAKLCAAVCLGFFLWQLSGLMPPGNKALRYLGDRSLQLMLLDSVFRFVLFAAAARAGLSGLRLIVPITVLDILLCAATCAAAERIPGVRFLFDLSAPANGGGNDCSCKKRDL